MVFLMLHFPFCLCESKKSSKSVKITNGWCGNQTQTKVSMKQMGPRIKSWSKHCVPSLLSTCGFPQAAPSSPKVIYNYFKPIILTTIDSPRKWAPTMVIKWSHKHYKKGLYMGNWGYNRDKWSYKHTYN